MKKCAKCGEWKHILEFYKDKNGIYGVRAQCKECQKKYSKEYYENNKEKVLERGKEYNRNNYIPRWVTYTLNRHKRRGIIFSLTFKEDLLKKALEKPSCPICHRELEWYSTGTGKLTDLSPTLDRTNNDNYMNINNVDIICNKCNVKKNSETLEENLAWCEQFKEYANNILRR